MKKKTPQPVVMVIPGDATAKTVHTLHTPFGRVDIHLSGRTDEEYFYVKVLADGAVEVGHSWRSITVEPSSSNVIRIRARER